MFVCICAWCTLSCSLAPRVEGAFCSQEEGIPVHATRYIHGANPRRRVFTFFSGPSLRTHTPQGQGSFARSPIPIIRPAGCASYLPGPKTNDRTPSVLQRYTSGGA